MNALPAPLTAAADRELVTARWLPFPPDAILRAWTEPATLARWWGPAGFSTTHRVHEPRPGGRWDCVLHGPDGRDYDNLAFFRGLDVCGVELAHVSPPRFDLIVSFTPDGDGTQVGWLQRFETRETCAAVAPVCRPANEQNLDRLTRVLRGESADAPA